MHGSCQPSVLESFLALFYTNYFFSSLLCAALLSVAGATCKNLERVRAAAADGKREHSHSRAMVTKNGDPYLSLFGFLTCTHFYLAAEGFPFFGILVTRQEP